MARPKKRNKHAGQPTKRYQDSYYRGRDKGMSWGQSQRGGGSYERRGGSRGRRTGGGGRGKQARNNSDSIAPYNFVPLPDKVVLVNDAPEFKVNGTNLPLWRTHDTFVESLHSGWIDLTLKTETPLFIRCGPPSDKVKTAGSTADEYRQDFFHHGDRDSPVIPGSSIRGMVRTLVEIVSYSKFLPKQHFTDQRLIYRMVGDTTSAGILYRNTLCDDLPKIGRSKIHLRYPSKYMHGGFLIRKGTEWFIQPSKTINETSIIHVPCKFIDGQRKPKNGYGHDPKKPYSKKDIIHGYVKPPVIMTHSSDNRGPSPKFDKAALRNRDEYTQLSRDKFEEVWIVKSGQMRQRSHYAAIYGPDTDKELIPIPHDLWRIYVEDARMTRGGKTRDLEKAYNDELKSGTKPKDIRVPLFYLAKDSYESEDNPGGIFFFGPTMMFRIPYEKSIADHVLSSLMTASGIDLTEGLFGTVGLADDQEAIKGRLQFEDATWIPSENEPKATPFLDEQVASSYRVPKILSGPKPTSFQHYLRQPIESRADGKKLKNWADAPEESNGNGLIRGFKLYWHKKEITMAEIFETKNEDQVNFLRSPESEEDTQHTIIRPVRKGVVFKGRIRFHNLNDIELGALLSVLDLPEEKRHKLGMGKPLGMGTVHITPTLFLIDRKRRYSSLFDSEGTITEAVQQCDNDTIDRYKNSFSRFVLSKIGSNLSEIWSVPRLADLYRLLEWQQPPSKEKTRYLLDLGKWRNRPRLPEPKDVPSSTPL